jgi:hypothetical protein
MQPLGDLVKKALETVGVTEERVQKLLGKECGCKGRRERLNALDFWARRVVQGKVQGAREYLRRILGQDPAESKEQE